MEVAALQQGPTYVLWQNIDSQREVILAAVIKHCFFQTSALFGTAINRATATTIYWQAHRRERLEGGYCLQVRHSRKKTPRNTVYDHLSYVTSQCCTSDSSPVALVGKSLKNELQGKAYLFPAAHGWYFTVQFCLAAKESLANLLSTLLLLGKHH